MQRQQSACCGFRYDCLDAHRYLPSCVHKVALGGKVELELKLLLDRAIVGANLAMGHVDGAEVAHGALPLVASGEAAGTLICSHHSKTGGPQSTKQITSMEQQVQRTAKYSSASTTAVRHPSAAPSPHSALGMDILLALDSRVRRLSRAIPDPVLTPFSPQALCERDAIARTPCECPC